MPFNTLSVATAVTPSVIETYFSHYLNRGPLRQKPTAHISYHEGLKLIRQFLDYSSKHAVEDLQAFTAQWVPTPTWARIQDSEIAPQFLERAANALHAQLGWRGLEKIGGKTWWQWRRPEQPLRAEWIEMKKDFNERKRTGKKCDRVILYVHGGAYYFGSVDEHRYQMQRHARKMNARVLAPRYRLAPQFPFPCGLYDCIATYFYLLEHFSPNQILFAGDSAGGGMVLSMLVTLRDQGFPLPAGTILLSPWVDLTHSFPSVAGDGVGDYIPPHGFHHKPSMAWPPPPSNEIKKVAKVFDRPTDAVELPAMEDDSTMKPKTKSAVPGLGDNLSIMLDGKLLEMNEQIQLYTPNDLLAHPLVSPIMQPSLGGLPPMLIQVGGAELLRDEQIYLAHKAANPKAFPPGDAILNEYDPRREMVNKYPPTDVQLQVWDDLCHVPTTLSFTRPAKYMYRSIAQFGAWALAHAQHRGIDIQNDDDISIISSGPEDGDDASVMGSDMRRKKTRNQNSMDMDAGLSSGAVGKAGDPLPPFRDHMVRQRVTRHGLIYPLAPQAEMACLALDPASIGRIKPGPVRKWLAKKRENDVKFSSEKKKVVKKRAKELASGYDTIPGETPPPTALVGRRRKGVAPEEKKKSKSWGLAMWSGWGSHHDESTIEREETLARQTGVAGQAPSQSLSSAKSTSNLSSSREASGMDGKKSRRTSSASMFSPPWSQKERPKSPYRQVTDAGQAGFGEINSQVGSTGSRTLYSRRSSTSTNMFVSRPVSVVTPTAGALLPDSVLVPGSQNTYLDPSNNRPHNGIMAYPFKLRNPLHSNPSIATIDSRAVSAMSNSDPNLGPVEMPTPADELVRPSPIADPAEPMSAVSAGSSSRAADIMGGVSKARTRSISPSSSSHVSSPLVGTPRSAVFSGHDRVFQNRSSVLGPIGADGMPTAPLMPRQNTDDKLSDPAAALAALEAPPTHAAENSVPVSPVDATKASPFRVRNPVFDSRAASPALLSGSEQPPPPPPKNGELTETPKAAPFKLRHTVTDPKFTPVRASTPESTRSAVSTPSPQQAASVSHPEEVAARAMTSVERPSTLELPPNSNVVMPTVVPRRPVAMPPSLPPPPPPKDERRNREPKASLDHKASHHNLSASNAPVVNDLTLTKGGDLVYEMGGDEKRPELESFFTAREGDLERVHV